MDISMIPFHFKHWKINFFCIHVDSLRNIVDYIKRGGGIFCIHVGKYNWLHEERGGYFVYMLVNIIDYMKRGGDILYTCW